ncbi:S8 family serine peptidase [Hymenobacter negativus]|uniref:S8 family serine peptidase n=1 Tax=Hymenobacter negativus TaxID=2795026 RepID=A0ABS3QBQ8_9BACT|nr:S8 family serine peptidase [Hymenobacter negativus]MBO2008448.1 S8 family serine peptidase [Hymenobacter negativus]
MKYLYRMALATALGLPALPGLAQPIAPATEPFALRLAVGDMVPAANADAWLAAPAAVPTDAWQGRVFRLLQFTHLPTEAQKATLRRAGVQLFDYLPLKAYTASLPAGLAHSQLAGLGLRSIGAMPGRWKLAGTLAQGTVPAHARRTAGQLEVALTYYPALTPAQVRTALAGAEFQVLSQDDFAHQMRVVLAETAVLRLAELPWVSTVEAAPAPGQPENFRGRTDHRANALATDYGAGRHYDGRGVTVGHGDDGAIGPHIDFQGRVDVSTAGVSRGDHGDHVAGTIMGAGNLEPRNRGQAVGAFNFYQDYPNNINQAPANYANSARRVRVTSSSYSDGNNAGYTSFARSLDQQMRQLPFLIHVFSSGNAGTSDFGYGAGAGWGNITGGQKMGKNVLTVGNVDYRDALASSSSRGPATDGRIKPEVCAVGTNVTSTYGGNTYATISGTSMACPGVSGVTAQLVGAYRSLNAGAEAPGALLKAVLMNTAEDLGNPGPDFRFGYGRINGLRAVRVLEGHTYFLDTLTQGQSRTFVVPAVAGKTQLRVMLHWTDYEGAANARPALVNNLDLVGTAVGTSTPIQPWILDHRPTVAQLNTAAVRGRDSINNAEQITIDNPSAPGGYSFTVSGRAVPQGRQGFWLTYSYIDEGVELTYPLGGEGFVPGETETLRWDAADSSLPFSVAYTLDNGQTYVPIASNLVGTARSTDWVVPTGLAAGSVKVRVTRGSTSSQSPAFFTVAPLPTNLRSEYRCLSESRLSWTASAGATSYTVYKLGTLYMDSLTTVTTPYVVLPGLGSGSDYWFAVRARGANGLLSRRTRAIYQASGLRDCPGPPLAGFEPSLKVLCPGSTLLLSDSSQSAPTSWAWVISPSAGVTFVNGTSATSQNPQVSFANLGTYTVSLTATNSYGPGSATRTNLITVSNGMPLAFSETFSTAATAFPPAGWRVENPSSTYTWELSPTAVVGPDNVSRRLPMVNDFDDGLRGAQDFLITPPLNLAGSTSPELTFAVAHRTYSSTFSDGLRVDISTDCGATFVPTSYLKRGTTLATVATASTSVFAPTSAAQWRQETVNLSAFRTPGPAAQTQTVLLRFVNLNDNGNNIYLTNVRVAERVATATTASQRLTDAFTAAPVPFGSQLRVTVAPSLTGTATLQLLDALGREVRRQPLILRPSPQQVAFDTDTLPAGVYVLHLSTAQGTQQLKVLK